jgi:hypothetical protein
MATLEMTPPHFACQLDLGLDLANVKGVEHSDFPLWCAPGLVARPYETQCGTLFCYNSTIDSNTLFGLMSTSKPTL